ncbi:MAG: hypothetical protein LBJ24_08655, partial [Treponema sp.]|nr:hypothetical protein [Treponema sp.]
TTVSLPAAASIGGSAFFHCTSLITLNLRAVPPNLGGNVFSSTGSGGTLQIHVQSSSAVDAYTGAWGVSASTVAGGNPAKYGSNHKAISIVAP